MKKTISAVFTVLCTLLLLWIVISFVDVILHNGVNGDGPMLVWNIFQIFFGG